MRSGPRTLRRSTQMPARPLHQRHESPRTGDNKGAIWRGRGGNIDGNLTILAGLIWLMHWAIPGLNGYTWVIDAGTGKLRRMTPAELVRHGNRWGVEGIRRWRRPNGEAPMTAEEAYAYAVKVGTVIVGELKSPAFGSDPRWARELRRICDEYDHPRWFKTLPKMRGARGKVAIFRASGCAVALIYGKGVRGRARRLRMTRRVAKHWTVKPNRTW